MRVFENGEYRDATPEEEAAINAEAANVHESLEDRIKTLEEELEAAKILLGVDE